MEQYKTYKELEKEVKKLSNENSKLQFVNTMVKKQNEKKSNEVLELENIIKGLKQELKYYENKYIRKVNGVGMN
ncbi:hypothetical protein [Clostridium sp.]|uniref:hypothetical protein n=1 Tax=Clostridium sp. TaxID=1506 RepID=UPI0026037A69|nr:hypothetical protein [Clostridium sp.]